MFSKHILFNKKTNGNYSFSKLEKIESGTIYPISKKDLSLPRFSGVQNKVIKNVPLSDIKDVGKHSLKRRHYHYILKHVKK